MKGKRRQLIYGLVITLFTIAAGVWLDPAAGLVSAIVGFIAAVGANLVSVLLQEYTGPSGFSMTTGVEATRSSLVLPPGIRLSRRRRSAVLVGLTAVLLLLAGIGSAIAFYYFTSSPSPTPRTLILVANFDEPDQTNYRVTDTLVQTLTQAFQDYPEVQVVRIDQRFRAGENNAVRELGTQRNATIVIWGWYGQTDTKVALSIHFEVIPALQKLPQLRREVVGSPQVLDLADLKSFAMQIDLSHEMTYLSLFVVGLTQSVDGKYDPAISSYTDALNISPPTTISQALERGPVYRYRGLAYLYKSEYDQAIADFTKAIKLDPNTTSAYNNRGVAYSNKSEYDQAIADYDQAIRLDPNNTDAYYNRGLTYIYKAEYNQNRGLAYLYKSEYDQAIADLTKAIKLDPNDPDAYFNRGVAYSNKSEYDQAIANYDQTIKLDPNHAFAYYYRGLVSKTIGKKMEAISDLEKVLELSNDSELRGDAEAQLRMLKAR
jgi:tetratricopeptide (TPR) repeat protein